MLEIDFEDNIKEFKHFTKIDDNTWLIQKNKESMMESYYVTILANAIVMYGDYDGVIVKPNECEREALINWMANATTLSYFCEKVGNGNQYHKYKEYSQRIAKESVLTMIRDKFDLQNNILKIIKDGYMLYFDDIRDDLIEAFSLELDCHPDDVESEFPEDFEEFENCISEYLYSSFEEQNYFEEFCSQHNFQDWYEYDFEDYTSRIRTQHQCLLWWARHLINGGLPL